MPGIATGALDPDASACAAATAEHSPGVRLHPIQERAHRYLRKHGQQALTAQSTAKLTRTPRVRQKSILLDEERRIPGLEHLHWRVSAVSVDRDDHVVSVETFASSPANPLEVKMGIQFTAARVDSAKVDVAQAPATTEGGKQTTMGNFGYASISEKSPNKEAAWEVVKWWTSADVINPYAAKIGLQTVRIDSSPPYDGELLKKVQELYVPAVQGIQVTENYYEMLTNIWPEVQNAYRGEQSGADAMKKAGEIVTGLLGS